MSCLFFLSFKKAKLVNERSADDAIPKIAILKIIKLVKIC